MRINLASYEKLVVEDYNGNEITFPLNKQGQVLVDSGIAEIVKMPLSEFEALQTKNPNTLYVVETSPASFGGLLINPVPLYYGANGFELKDSDWNHDSYQSVYGKNIGSYYFSFIELGQLFESASFTQNNGSIDNLLDPFDGWRLPVGGSGGEIARLISYSSATAREGATVNGVRAKCYALVDVSGVSHAGGTPVRGMLYFPDGYTINGATINFGTTNPTTISITELNVYLNQGCVFLPCSGRYQGGWSSGNSFGYYWTATTKPNTTNKTEACYVENGMYTAGSGRTTKPKSTAYLRVFLVKEVDRTYDLYVGNSLVSYYKKPADGIPKTDLSSEVQTSLALANTALLFTEQTLTEEQQAQARENIDALGGDDVEAVSEVDVDTTPTANSSHLITSGGVYAVLGDIESLINAL